MPVLDEIPSSPPGPSTSLEASLKYYKKQYEVLEAELLDFQNSSKDLEAELEKDIEASEKRERQLKEKATNLQYEVDEWKEKYKQSKSEAGITQNRLQKEITDLRDQHRTLQLKLRDIEVANDDYERKQRNTETSLEDTQAQYDKAFEKTVILEHEVQAIEQERETLRIDVQRSKDELQDFKIEAEILKERLKKAEIELERKATTSSMQRSLPQRPELSPTNTNTSTPSFDTPPTKTVSSTVPSDTPTPPSPPVSERSVNSSKQIATPSVPRPRLSLNASATSRQSTYGSRPNGHTRGPSITARSSTYRQSLSKPATIAPRTAGLPQSSSIMQLRTLRGKMQKLEERVQTARSKLPAPVSTPPRGSPRPGSALGQQAIPTSVTVRSRRRVNSSSIAGPGSLPDNNSDAQSTPSVPAVRHSRPSISHQYSSTTSPTRQPGSMLPPRPSSRASGISSRQSGFVPSHSRPGSRTSISNFRAPLGNGMANQYAPNASTDRVRPISAMSDHRKSTYDGTFDDDPIESGEVSPKQATEIATTPTPRRTTLSKSRTSDVGGATGIPTPLGNKRASLSGFSRLAGPGVGRRQSGIGVAPARPDSRASAGDREASVGESNGGSNRIRPPSRALGNVKETYDVNETF